MMHYLFPKLMVVIKGTRFPDLGAIKKAVTTELRKKPGESFHEDQDVKVR